MGEADGYVRFASQLLLHSFTRMYTQLRAMETNVVIIDSSNRPLYADKVLVVAFVHVWDCASAHFQPQVEQNRAEYKAVMQELNKARAECGSAAFIPVCTGARATRVYAFLRRYCEQRVAVNSIRWMTDTHD
jgi:hypothetical protein